MANSSLVLNRALLADGSLAAISIVDGVIESIRPVDTTPVSEETIDLDGALVLPGFVEGHIHLDKCFIGDGWHPYRAGSSIADRIRIEREELAKASPVLERARALVELCVANGTSTIRTHIDVDPDIGLSHLDAILAVREEYRDCVEIEIVAFPQHGILVKPGTLDLMDAALNNGADLVGGLDPASFDGDVKGHLDAVFGLAEKHGRWIDIHLHDGGELGAFEIEQIAMYTVALGMQGKVAISHAYGLGAIGDGLFARVADAIAGAGISIMTNAPGDHAFPPVKRLRSRGVNVFAGSDNVRDSWWPYGNADMFDRAMMIGYRSGFYLDEELEIAFDLITRAGATALGLDSYGIAEGDPANLVAVRASHVPEAVVTHPVRELVLHDGRIVARNGKFGRG